MPQRHDTGWKKRQPKEQPAKPNTTAMAARLVERGLRTAIILDGYRGKPTTE